MKKLLSLCLPAGMIIFIGYNLYNKFVSEIPLGTKSVLCSVSIVLLIVGMLYYSMHMNDKKKK